MSRCPHVDEAVRRIPSALPVDPLERSSAICNAVIGHYDAHITWPLQQHAAGNTSRRTASAAIAEGLRRSRSALHNLGLGDVDFATGNTAVAALAEAMLDAYDGSAA